MPLELFRVRLLSVEMLLGMLMSLAEPAMVIDDVPSALRFVAVPPIGLFRVSV